MQCQWLPVLDHYLLIPLSPYFQPIERGHMSEGRLNDLGLQENIYIPSYVNPWEKTIRPGGTDFHPNTSEIGRVSTYTGLDNYDALFATIHGRGVLDQVSYNE